MTIEIEVETILMTYIDVVRRYVHIEAIESYNTEFLAGVNFQDNDYVLEQLEKYNPSLIQPNANKDKLPQIIEKILLKASKIDYYGNQEIV